MIGVVLKFVSVVCFSEVSCFRFVVSNPEGGGVDNSRCGGFFVVVVVAPLLDNTHPTWLCKWSHAQTSRRP